MSSSLIQLLVLAGIAVFLIVKLRSVLGTREGFEKPPVPLGLGQLDRHALAIGPRHRPVIGWGQKPHSAAAGPIRGVGAAVAASSSKSKLSSRR